MIPQSTTGCPPESLRLIEAWLIRNGYIAAISRVTPSILQADPGVPNTITGWRLTWSLRTTRTKNGWEEFGSLWVADGAGPSATTTLFTSASLGSHVSDDG